MNANKVLDTTLKDILEVVQPLRDHWLTRFSVIRELEDIVQSVESLRGATVEPFGSFVSNLFSRWGDLDVCVLLTTNGTYISSAGKKRKVNLLEDLLKAFKQKGGWRRLQFIPNARVPILKLESGQGISCDISIDNIQGQMKSKFLLWINNRESRFRDMVLLVKEWAKAHKINNPKSGTLNSYSLSLMVIFHFQTCVPAILPPLKEIYPTNIADDLTGVRADVERRIEEICHQNMANFASNKSRKVNRSSLSQLFISFLAKFADIDVRAREQGICPFTGRWEYINSNTRWMPRTYKIFIEDPFEQPENTARGVTAGNLEKISEAFRVSHQRLVSGSLNQLSLIGMLVRPHVAYHVAGVPPGNPIYSLHRSHPSSGAYSSRPRQNQHQNAEDHSNSSMMQKRLIRPNKLTLQRREGYLDNLNEQRPIQLQNLYNQRPVVQQNLNMQRPVRQQNSYMQRPLPQQNSYMQSPLPQQNSHMQNSYMQSPLPQQNSYMQSPLPQQNSQPRGIWRPRSNK